jgi:transposase
MHAGQLIFAQLMEFLPRQAFHACVRRYRGERCVRAFSCRDQFLCMAFAQLTGRESLRDIETCLRAVTPKLYHAGFRSRIARSTLADANERRDWRIYADFAQVLIARARQLYTRESLGVELEAAAYALDSSIIELSLGLFPWAHSQRQKAAIKLHSLLDLHGNIPTFMRISTAKTSDAAMLDNIPLEPGAYYILDRGYNDFGRLHRLTQAGAFFVVRVRKNVTFRRQRSQAVDRTTGLRSDQVVLFRDRRTHAKYPQPLRRVTFVDVPSGRRFRLLTNDFTLTALSIPQLYHRRWQVELFFKWIKQHLRIRRFLGQSPNAVKTQIWIAASVYVLVAIIKWELRINRSLYEILQILSVTLFENEPLFTTLSQHAVPNRKLESPNQLPLFDF